MKNIIGFNISWFGLVYMGNGFIPFALLFLCFHLMLEVKNTREILYILIICAIGILIDSVLQFLGIFSFQELTHLPFWLIVLWGCFATTLCHSLKFIGLSPWFQIAAGFIAPLSYLAGYKFSVVQFSHSLMFTYAVLAVLWTLLFILFFKLKSVLVDKEHCHD